MKDKSREMITPFSVQGLVSEISNPLVLLPGLLCAIVLFVVFSTTFTFIPLIGEDLHISSSQLSSFMVAYFITSMILNMLLNKITIDNKKFFLGILSLCLLSIGTAITGFSNSFSTLMLAQIIIGVAFGIGYPLFLGLAMEKSKNTSRTISMGVFQSIYSIGMFAGPPVSTYLAEVFGIPAMAIIISVAVLIIGTSITMVYMKKIRTITNGIN
jgi:MFS family permease